MFYRVINTRLSFTLYYLEFLEAEAYLGPSRISTMERLCKNSPQLFSQKGSVVDVRLGSKYASAKYRNRDILFLETKLDDSFPSAQFIYFKGIWYSM